MRKEPKKFAAVSLAMLLLAAVCLLSAQMDRQAAQDSREPPLDYADGSNWAFWADTEGVPVGGEAAADVFLLCPTVGVGKEGDRTLDLGSEKNRTAFVAALLMERGIYDGAAALYAPFYRQMTFAVYNLPAGEQAGPREIAYRDVEAAFVHYLARSEPDRPLILAGFSQGSQHLLRLMEEYFDDPACRERLVAAYCIGWPVTEQDLAQFPHLAMAQAEDDVGVIVSFNSESPETTDSLVVPEGTCTLGINPLNWRTDSLYADKSLNPGACLMNRDGSIKDEQPALTGAYLDPTRGTLKLPDLDPADWHSSLFPDGVYHLYDYQFFYRSLQQNVAVRTEAWLAQHGAGIRDAA